MHTADGRTIIGEAKDKDRARAEHDQAVAEGKKTALLDWVSGDGTLAFAGSRCASDNTSLIVRAGSFYSLTRANTRRAERDDHHNRKLCHIMRVNCQLSENLIVRHGPNGQWA